MPLIAIPKEVPSFQPFKMTRNTAPPKTIISEQTGPIAMTVSFLQGLPGPGGPGGPGGPVAGVFCAT